ncbi:MAG: hypothetical protein Q8L15_18395 [Methylobacter sp.]|nr:hypothetical protein [Methylobacter sp.]
MIRLLAMVEHCFYGLDEELNGVSGYWVGAAATTPNNPNTVIIVLTVFSSMR